MEFAYLFKVLMRRKWIILACTVVALVAAYFFTKKIKHTYKSVAQLSTGFTVIQDLKLSDENFSLPQIDVKFNNAIENITSPKVLSLVSYRMMIHDLENPKEAFTAVKEEDKQKDSFKKTDQKKLLTLLKQKLEGAVQLSPSVPEEKDAIAFLEVYDYDIGTIKNNLNVARYQRTDYINIDYVSQNPKLSAYAVNTLCQEFKRFYGLDQRERSDVSVVSLDSLVKQKKAIFDQKIQQKNQFMSSEGVLDVGLEGSNKLGQVGTFESQLIEEKANQSNLSYQVAQLTKLIDAAKAKGMTSVIAPTTSNSGVGNAEYMNLRKQYNSLNAQYIASGSSDAEIKRKMDEISQKMQKIDLADNSGGVTQDGGAAPVTIDQLIQRRVGLEGQLKATTQKISSIQSKISQLNGGLTGMAAKSANIEQLDKEIEMASAEYKEATQRYNLALNMTGATPGVFKQTMFGEPALLPEPSRKFMIMAISGITALIISCLIIIGKEFFDNSVKTPSAFQRLTGLPLLGVVNWVKFQQSNVLEKITLFNEKEVRHNLFRELLRKLRYELESNGKRIYLFTSTEPQQGKTTLIQSLAYSLSLSKKRVLIIDTNFCNNDLTKATNANPVLEKFSLNGKPFSFEDLKSFISKTNAEGVDVIGCEGGDYTPSEILPKNHLLNYLDQLREEYDFIFLEGAPLNGFTDTKELIKYADGLIAVFSAEATFSAADKESIAFLNENREKFIGAVLNKVQEDNLAL